MRKMKKFIGSLLLGVMCFSLSGISMAAGSLEKTEQNPYVQQYIKEKNSKPTKASSDALVDPEVEEKIIMATLQEYYNEDVKVANILNNYGQDPQLFAKTVSLEKDDKIAVMHKIKKVYSSVKDLNDQEVLRCYLHRYARSTKDTESKKFLDELDTNVQPLTTGINEAEELLKHGKTKKDSSSVTATATSYDGTKAGDWAYSNYNKYSTNFPAFTAWGSDCTNFVSQAMYAGGKSMAGTWYCYKKNSTYLVPKSATELNYSWTLSDPSPWISVSTFNDYWRDKSVDHSYDHDYYVANHNTIYDYSIYKGDVVVFSKGVAGFITVPTHAMIISAYDNTNKDFKLAGHSTERQAYALLDAISNYSCIDIYEIP